MLRKMLLPEPRDGFQCYFTETNLINIYSGTKRFWFLDVTQKMYTNDAMCIYCFGEAGVRHLFMKGRI